MFKLFIIFAFFAFSFAAKKPKFQTWLICGNSADYKAENPLTGIKIKLNN